ncbi:MAG: hypothetical protein MRY83_01650 [Flavobacteriales bacterium]|nr:hypothetical protein [Flavobacteriales bacterium]
MDLDFKKILDDSNRFRWKVTLKNFQKAKETNNEIPHAINEFFHQLSGCEVKEISDGHRHTIFTIGSLKNSLENPHTTLIYNDEFWPEILAQGFGDKLEFDFIKEVYLKYLEQDDSYRNYPYILYLNPFHTLISINGESEELLFCKDFLNKDFSFWIFSSNRFQKIHLELNEIISLFFNQEDTNLEKVFNKGIKSNRFDPELLEDLI